MILYKAGNFLKFNNLLSSLLIIKILFKKKELVVVVTVETVEFLIKESLLLSFWIFKLMEKKNHLLNKF